MASPIPIAPRTEAPPSLKYFMAIGCGVMVANIYYCQPLLGAFARQFRVGEGEASLINILTQCGYGLGLFFIVPLGDKIPRRRMILWMHGAACLSLLGAGLSGKLWVFASLSLVIGMATTACQVFLPFAAHLSRDDERGRVIGIIMGGLLAGILASRTLSGLVAQYFGWRVVYFFAAALMACMGWLFFRILPGESPAFRGSYGALMRSLGVLARQHPVVRQSAVIGAALFGAISAFWATMAFFLEAPPFRYSLSVIGLFGLVGAGGALSAPLIGKIIDRGNPLRTIRWGSLVIILGYAVLWAGQSGVAWVIAGVILLDLGLQAAHIPNMARNYALLPEARTRINTIYMTSFFIGGTLGSTLGSVAWDGLGWKGVCGTGLALSGLGLAAAWFRFSNKSKK
ncbi:MAG TPA: MFS transporter [Chitinophagaceae bacterium]|nr:MFS transporter [Chitinophagaceae bacterium]